MNFDKIDNQQLLQLDNEQLQVFLSGKFGDGCLTTTNSNSTYYVTNCKYEEYIDYKINLLGSMFKNKSFMEQNGFCKTPIYTMRSCSSDILKYIKNLPLEKCLDYMNDLGIALWFYDDGSLHKNKLFYNLNTHALSYDFQVTYLLPFFQKYNIYPVLTSETKKDGRQFWYLRIPKFKGAAEVSKILSKYPVKCYSYKLWSSETIQKWSKLQEELKRQGKDYRLMNGYSLSCMLKKITL